MAEVMVCDFWDLLTKDPGGFLFALCVGSVTLRKASFQVRCQAALWKA
jgi:hypothetical protein